MSTDRGELLNLLDDWTKVYRKALDIVCDDVAFVEDTYEKTCRILVDNGLYKESDLFWTKECLENAEKEAKRLFDNLKED